MKRRRENFESWVEGSGLENPGLEVRGNGFDGGIECVQSLDKRNPF